MQNISIIYTKEFCVHSLSEYIQNKIILKKWGLGGIEPPTSPTLKENHTTRPKAHDIAPPSSDIAR